jgi:beta-lactamase regulating signal transducer with metallopeptidase domain
MNTFLIDYVIGNALLALPLAIIAWCIGRRQRHPSVTHALWAIVLVRLLLPPIGSVPGFSVRVPLGTLQEKSSSFDETRTTEGMSFALLDGKSQHASIDEVSDLRILAPVSVSADAVSRDANSPGAVDTKPIGPTKSEPRPFDYIKRHTALGLVSVWLAGSISLIIFSMLRILRFRKLLQYGAVPADESIQSLARDAAAKLGQPLDAEILVTTARTPPFVWWLGIRPQIVLPNGILKGLPIGEQRLVIAHELAHIQRKDHLVRWLEWFAVSWLWWNPLVWIARYGLRNSEELACDALVLRALKPEPREYGSCLLSVAEALSERILVTPSLACTMSSGQSLEQRIVLIMSSGLTNRPSMLLRSFSAAIAGIVLLLGVAGGKDPSEEPDPWPESTLPRPEEQSEQATIPAREKLLETQSAPRRAILEKIVDHVSSIHVATLNSSIHIVRDETVNTVHITAEIEPSSDEISDSLFASEVGAVKLIADQDDGQLEVGLGWNSDSGVQPTRLTSKLTLRVPKLKTIAVESVNGNLLVEGDVGEVQAESVNASIEIRNIVESAKVESVNGTLKLSLADSARCNIEATSANSDISLSLPESWQGLLDATASFASVEIANLPGIAKKNAFGQQYKKMLGQTSASKAELKTFNGSIQIQRR